MLLDPPFQAPGGTSPEFWGYCTILQRTIICIFFPSSLVSNLKAGIVPYPFPSSLATRSTRPHTQHKACLRMELNSFCYTPQSFLICMHTLSLLQTFLQWCVQVKLPFAPSRPPPRRNMLLPECPSLQVPPLGLDWSSYGV